MISLFGGSGFIGGNWSRFTYHPHEVIGRDSLLPSPHSWDSLYFISTTHNYHVWDNPFLDIETNLTHLMQVLSRHKEGSTFNFISSWFVYGDIKGRANEGHPCDPRGFYSITKRTAEQLLISYCETHKINWRILRLANIFGPGDSPSPKKNALQFLIGQLAEHKPISLYWGGDCFRDYLFVTDAVRAIDKVLSRGPLNTITNIGYGRSHKFGELIAKAKSILNSQSEITACEPTKFHQQVQAKDFFMDTSRLAMLGFVPETTVTEGIRECCRHIVQSRRSPAKT